MPALPSILLVDDDYTVNFLNTKLLQRLGAAAEILTAAHGREALDILRARCQPPTPSCPALIFLDIHMPVMDGFEFLEAYQNLPVAQQQGQVIVMLTTSVNPNDVKRLQGLPIAGSLVKPLTADKITQVLEEHFGHAPTQE